MLPPKQPGSPVGSLESDLSIRSRNTAPTRFKLTLCSLDTTPLVGRADPAIATPPASSNAGSRLAEPTGTALKEERE